MFKKVVKEYSAKRIIDEAQSESSVPSIVGTNCLIKGEVSGSSILDIFGEFDGKIECKVLTIRQGGKVTGEIRAQYVKIAGIFKGSIVANVLHFVNGCDVESETEYGIFSIEEKAKFVGSARYNESLVTIEEDGKL